MKLPIEIENLLQEGDIARHVHWSGKSWVPEEVRYGWVIRFAGPTTEEERAVLKAHGFKFSGGKWGRPDP